MKKRNILAAVVGIFTAALICAAVSANTNSEPTGQLTPALTSTSQELQPTLPVSQLQPAQHGTALQPTYNPQRTAGCLQACDE